MIEYRRVEAFKFDVLSYTTSEFYTRRDTHNFYTGGLYRLDGGFVIRNLSHWFKPMTSNTAYCYYSSDPRFDVLENLWIEARRNPRVAMNILTRAVVELEAVFSDHESRLQQDLALLEEIQEGVDMVSDHGGS